MKRAAGGLTVKLVFANVYGNGVECFCFHGWYRSYGGELSAEAAEALSTPSLHDTPINPSINVTRSLPSDCFMIVYKLTELP